MFKYKCKSVGDCSVANRGDFITSESMLNDPKCSDCGCALELVEEGGKGASAGGSVPKSGLLIAVVAAAAVLAGGLPAARADCVCHRCHRARLTG